MLDKVSGENAFPSVATLTTPIAARRQQRSFHAMVSNLRERRSVDVGGQ